MDRQSLDDLARSLALALSRRNVVRGSGATSLGAVMAVLAWNQAAAACKANRQPCKQGTDCCSGTCKRRNGKKRCRATPGARGCTIEHACGAACPGDPNGFCALRLNDKPFCFTIGKCEACTSDADCIEFSGGNPKARCVQCPNLCDAEDNFRQCVVPGPA
jgi:hypothetical protein